MSSVRCLLFIALVSAALAGLTAPVKAQSSVEEAFRLLDEGSFEQALDRFANAERGSLTRDELIRLLEGRALCYLALRDNQNLDRTLAQLGVVNPRHTFSETYPPDLAQGFARFRERSPSELRLDIVVRSDRRGVRLEGIPRHTEGLPVDYRLHAMPEGGTWQSSLNEDLVLPTEEARIYYFGTLHGPGDALLTRQGSANQPELFLRDPAVENDEGGPPWETIIGVGAGVVVVTAVTIVLVAALSSETSTQPGRPVLR